MTLWARRPFIFIELWYFKLGRNDDVIWDYGSSKSSGLDDFNFKFIKEFWHILKGDIIKFLDDFHVSSNFTRGTNASSITLISKINEPQGWGDYRPISLVGCMYKVVTKVLAKRLQKVLHGMIDERQCVFLGGEIFYSVLLLIRWWMKLEGKRKSA